MIRVTEAAAIAAAKWIGRGNKLAADGAAVDAMRERLNNIKFAAQVVIGEGKKDDAPGLFDGDWVGLHRDKHILTSSSVGETIQFMNREPYYELAVDPIEGTTPTSDGGPEAISVLAFANEGCLLQTQRYYMRKIAVGPQVKNKVDISIDDPLNSTLRKISYALDKDIPNITVCILDRPRHDDAIKRLRQIGCKIKLIQDCDVTGAVCTGFPETGVDLLIGIGGAPEGVITACAMKCLGGEFQARLVERENWKDTTDDILMIEDLAKGDVVFCATGITDGTLLRGVRYINNLPQTNSLLMRSESNTIRKIEGLHGN
jgi:fructose-1,6-bisphosphatase II